MVRKKRSGPLIKKIKFSISEPSGYESMGGERLICTSLNFSHAYLKTKA